MEMVYLHDRSEKDDFAIKAAKHFKKYPKHSTFTDNEIESNVYFALRFGLDDDCVIVFKIGVETPTNYQNLISAIPIKPHT